MAPLHHHFELAGWTENTVIVRFWLVAAHGRRLRDRAVLRRLARLRRAAGGDGWSAAHRRWSPGSGSPGAAAARVLLRPRRPGAAHRRRRARRASPSWSRPARRWLGAAERPCPTAPTWSSPRPGWRPDAPLLVDAAAPRASRSSGEPELAWRLRVAGPGRRAAPVAGGHRHQRQDDDGDDARGDPAAPPGGGRSPRATSGCPLVEVVTAVEPTARRPTTSLAVELSSFQLHWSSSLRPAAAARAQRRRRPHRLARLASPPTATRRRASCGWRRSRVADADDPVAAALVAGHRHAGDGHPRRAGARPARASVADALVDRAFADDPARRACWSTLARPAGPRRRTTSPTPSPRPRWPGRSASPPRRSARGLAGFRGGAHRNVARRQRRRRRLRRRQQGDQPARRRRLAGRLPAGGLDRRRPAQGRRRRRRWSPRSPPRLAGVVLLGRDRDRIAAALARHAPMVPVVDGRQRRR